MNDTLELILVGACIIIPIVVIRGLGLLAAEKNREYREKELIEKLKQEIHRRPDYDTPRPT